MKTISQVHNKVAMVLEWCVQQWLRISRLRTTHLPRINAFRGYINGTEGSKGELWCLAVSVGIAVYSSGGGLQMHSERDKLKSFPNSTIKQLGPHILISWGNWRNSQSWWARKKMFSEQYDHWFKYLRGTGHSLVSSQYQQRELARKSSKDKKWWPPSWLVIRLKHHRGEAGLSQIVFRHPRGNLWLIWTDRQYDACIV